MKRIQSACILQTLLFSQKEDSGLTPAQALAMNRTEVAQYKARLDRYRTRYQITSEQEQPDGSILLRVRKQYNGKAGVEEYFLSTAEESR